jgi:hypothetical protein
MTSRYSDVLSPAGERNPARPSRRPPVIGRWAAWLGIAAQVVFVASVLVAAAWQGPRYSVLAHSISDMYAVTAPHASFLVVTLTDCGAATILFALLSVWPALRPGGRAATVGSVLLALSIGGLGDLLTPAERVACRLADPGCTPALALSNSGGKMDSAVSTVGVLLFVAAGFFLAAAMRRVPGWQAWAWPTRGSAVLVFALTVADVADAGLGGLFERLAAAAMATGVAALGVGILRRSRNLGPSVIPHSDRQTSGNVPGFLSPGTLPYLWASTPRAHPAFRLRAARALTGMRPGWANTASAELADVPDDVFDWAVLGEVDVVDDRAVAEPDQPFGSGGDLRIVGGEQDRHVVFGA